MCHRRLPMATVAVADPYVHQDLMVEFIGLEMLAIAYPFFDEVLESSISKQLALYKVVVEEER